MNIVDQNIESIKSICSQHYVDTLYLFGSHARGEQNSPSDIDLMVNFKVVPKKQYFENFLSLKNQLESLLKKPVDLLEAQTLKNPVLLRTINKDKLLVYGREN